MIQTKKTGPTQLFYLYAVLFVVLPWSPDVAFGDWHIRLPSEALTVLSGVALGWVVWRTPALLKAARYRQVLVWSGVIYLVWMSICMLCSSMPPVSVKYGLIELGQWWVFFAGLLLFPDWWRRLLPFFVCSMAGVVVFTLAHHYQYDFRADQSMLAPQPFFPDHTLYSAVLVMLLPILPFQFKRPVATGIAVLFLTGLVYAACRAAWVSLFLAIVLLSPFFFQQKWKWLLLPLGLALLGGFLGKDKLQTKIDRDVSSLERINRYACALRMAKERPVTGFGPGTFQFQYLPFQRAGEMTRISITDPAKDLRPDQFGRGGGAHSEYFQALAETGWPGLVLWMLLVGAAVFTGLSRAFSAQSKENQWLMLAVTCSLLSFFLHALFNNFLHDGRVAMLFWGQIAWLVNRES